MECKEYIAGWAMPILKNKTEYSMLLCIMKEALCLRQEDRYVLYRN